MSKKSKRRNKKYSGWDASTDDSTVTVHKLSAEPRSDFKQWLVDHKKLIRIVIIVAVIIGIVLFIVLYKP